MRRASKSSPAGHVRAGAVGLYMRKRGTVLVTVDDLKLDPKQSSLRKPTGADVLPAAGFRTAVVPRELAAAAQPTMESLISLPDRGSSHPRLLFRPRKGKRNGLRSPWHVVDGLQTWPLFKMCVIPDIGFAGILRRNSFRPVAIYAGRTLGSVHVQWHSKSSDQVGRMRA